MLMFKRVKLNGTKINESNEINMRRILIFDIIC